MYNSISCPSRAKTKNRRLAAQAQAPVPRHASRSCITVMITVTPAHDCCVTVSSTTRRQGFINSIIAMFRSMETCPTEIWYEIFAFVCTDSGLNGRSLSLVSKRFHDLSGPLKYQSIAITQWRQIAFSQTFSQLPDIQKKIKYLFIYCPYPFLEVEDAPRLLQNISNFEDLFTDVEDSDMEFDGSMKSDEEQELFEDLEYLLSINNDLPPQPNDTRCRDDHSEGLDYEIQAVFDKATQALHAKLL